MKAYVRRRVLATILLGAIALPGALAAQTTSLTWTEVSRVDASSMLAPVLRMAGVGDPVESRHALHLQGGALIQVTDNAVGVVDLDAGLVMAIDHEQGTVITMTFEEVAAFTGQLVDMFSQTMNAMGPEMLAAQEQMAAGMGDIQYALNAWASGLTGDFGGFDAAQHFVTLGMEMGQGFQGVGAGGGGQLFVVSEIWETDQFPTEEELFGEWGLRVAADPGLIEVAQSMNESGGSISGALAMWDPGLAQAMIAMTEAIEGIGGTTVQEAMVIAMSSPDDAPPVGDVLEQGIIDELLAWDPGSSGGGGGGMPGLGDIAAGALGGFFGGGGGGDSDQDADQDAVTPGGMTPLVRIVTDRENLSYEETNDDVLGTLNQQIEDYTVQSLQDLMGQMNQLQPSQ